MKVYWTADVGGLVVLGLALLMAVLALGCFAAGWIWKQARKLRERWRR